MIYYAGQTVLELSTGSPVVITKQEVDSDGEYYTSITVLDGGGVERELSPTDVGPLYGSELRAHKREIFHGSFCSYVIGQKEIQLPVDEVQAHLATVAEAVGKKELKSKNYTS
jgi:hypothetical protein